MIDHEPKWLCVFLIDVSASMGKDSLVKLNKELRDFHQSIKEDETLGQRTELCIMTYGQGVRILQEPSLVEDFTMPDLSANYSVTLSKAIHGAIEKIKERVIWYKNTGQVFYRPLLVLATHKLVREELFYRDSRIRDGVSARKFDFLNIGMNGDSLLAKKDEILIRQKEDRSLFQMLFHVWDSQIDHCEDVLVLE